MVNSMDTTQYLDNGEWKIRPCTPEEQLEIDERRAAGIPVDVLNAPILEKLIQLDLKTIRALREGNTVKIAEHEQQAINLRSQLKK